MRLKFPAHVLYDRSEFCSDIVIFHMQRQKSFAKVDCQFGTPSSKSYSKTSHFLASNLKQCANVLLIRNLKVISNEV